jgi:hypothetical protein
MLREREPLSAMTRAVSSPGPDRNARLGWRPDLFEGGAVVDIAAGQHKGQRTTGAVAGEDVA